MTVVLTESFTDSNGVSLPTHNPSFLVNSGAFAVNTNELMANAALDGVRRS